MMMLETSAFLSKDNSNVKQTKISEGICDLVDEKKPLWHHHKG